MSSESPLQQTRWCDLKNYDDYLGQYTLLFYIQTYIPH